MPESGIREIVALARVPDCEAGLILENPTLPRPITSSKRRIMQRYRRDPIRPASWLAIYQRSGCGKDTESQRTRCAGQSVIITNGATSGLLNALITTIEPGDEVLMPDPGWPVWEMILAARGRPVRYLTPRANNFFQIRANLIAMLHPRPRRGHQYAEQSHWCSHARRDG